LDPKGVWIDLNIQTIMDSAAIPGWSSHSKKHSNPRHKDPNPTNYKVPNLSGFGFTKLRLKVGKIFFFQVLRRW
jgi:hypothetical protein